MILLAITALALALRASSLSRSLFTDETYSLALAQRGFGHMLGLFGYEANGMPYPIVLWPLIRIFGDGEAVLRAPAVLAGTASVPALWWAARRLGYSDAVALVAAALLAVNPMAVWYSQEARAYALVVLAACLAFGALPRALGPRNGRAFAGYVAAMALLGYCDLLALPIALPAQALIAKRAGREGMRRWLWSLAAVLVCCIPLIVAAVIARGRRNALYWLPKLSRSLVEGAVQEFTGGLSGVSAVRWVTLLAVLLLVAAAWWRLRQARPGGDSAAERSSANATVAQAAAEGPGFRLAVAATWGLAPSALLLAVSAVEPVFWPRYAILALPGLCLLVAQATAQLWEAPRWRALAVACVAAVLVAGALADARQQSVLQENWPPTVAWLRAERLPGEAVVVDNALVLPSLGYYVPALRASDGVVVVQEWHDRALPAGFVGYKDPTGYGSVPVGPPSAATVRELARRGGGGVWLVVSEVDERLQGGDPRSGAAVAWARGHCHVQVRESVGVWVLHASACLPLRALVAGRICAARAGRAYPADRHYRGGCSMPGNFSDAAARIAGAARPARADGGARRHSSPARIAAGTSCVSHSASARTRLLQLGRHARRARDVVVGVGGDVVHHPVLDQLEREAAHSPPKLPTSEPAVIDVSTPRAPATRASPGRGEMRDSAPDGRAATRWPRAAGRARSVQAAGDRCEGGSTSSQRPPPSASRGARRRFGDARHRDLRARDTSTAISSAARRSFSSSTSSAIVRGVVGVVRADVGRGHERRVPAAAAARASATRVLDRRRGRRRCPEARGSAGRSRANVKATAARPRVRSVPADRRPTRPTVGRTKARRDHVQIDRGGHRRLGHGHPGGAPGGRSRRRGRREARARQRLRAGVRAAAARGRREAPEDLQWAINPREDVDVTLEAAAAIAREAGCARSRLPAPGRPRRRDPRRRGGAGGRPDRGGQQGHDGRQALPARLGAQQGLPSRALLGADHPHDLSRGGPAAGRARQAVILHQRPVDRARDQVAILDCTGGQLIERAIRSPSSTAPAAS